MVQLLIGHKGSGKTNQMIQLANECIKTCDGSVVFINKNHRLMYELSYRIRVICMEDFEHITNIDEYIGEFDLPINPLMYWAFIKGVPLYKDIRTWIRTRSNK